MQNQMLAFMITANVRYSIPNDNLFCFSVKSFVKQFISLMQWHTFLGSMLIYNSFYVLACPCSMQYNNLI